MTTGIDLSSTMRDFPRADPFVICPSCGEEWTKLRECFWFEDNKKQTSSVCVECAESLKSFKWITETWPIVKPFENWEDDWIEIYSFWPKEKNSYAYCNSFDFKTRQPIKEKVIFWKALMTIIKCWSGKKTGTENSEIFKFLLRGDFASSKVSAHDLKNKDNEAIVYDNSIEAWFGMRNRIAQAQETKKKGDEIGKNLWNGGQKKFPRF